MVRRGDFQKRMTESFNTLLKVWNKGKQSREGCRQVNGWDPKMDKILKCRVWKLQEINELNLIRFSRTNQGCPAEIIKINMTEIWASQPIWVINSSRLRDHLSIALATVLSQLLPWPVQVWAIWEVEASRVKSSKLIGNRRCSQTFESWNCRILETSRCCWLLTRRIIQMRRKWCNRVLCEVASWEGTGDSRRKCSCTETRTNWVQDSESNEHILLK